MNSYGFMPHGFCFEWRPGVLWLHIISDLSIGIAYFGISFLLFYFVRKRSGLPFQLLFFLFSAFIILCGVTHFFSIWVLWHPNYYLEGYVKALTAIVSVVTFVTLLFWLPRVLQTALSLEMLLATRSKELAAANDELRAQIAARETIETALRQSHKMEAIGQLTGGIAHDFNNLLAGISGSLQLLEARLAQGRISELDRYLHVAQGAAKRAAMLTHRLLAFSARQTLDPKPVDVNRLVADMDELVRRSVGPSITVELVQAAGLWPTRIDSNQLENALLNLCINARDAMPDGGRITIETANRWLDRHMAKVRDVPEGQYISLCVSDTGTGMPPEIISRAFDPFFTTKPIGEGTGLGLSMIYGFVRQSGGQVRIYSEVGKGTMVCVYLPRYQGALADTELLPEMTNDHRSTDGETVLIVDDEPSVRMMVTEVLEDLGYNVFEAEDGPTGLKILDSPRRIDLLITDVGLPGGMNGRQLADAALKNRPELKVLFVTGYAENAVIGDGHLQPGMHILTKPFPLESLATRIKEIIGDTKQH